MIDAVFPININKASNKLSSICVRGFIFRNSSDSEDTIKGRAVSLLASNYSDLSALSALQISLAASRVVVSANRLVYSVALRHRDVSYLCI
jgi:hypothetical protein